MRVACFRTGEHPTRRQLGLVDASGTTVRPFVELIPDAADGVLALIGRDIDITTIDLRLAEPILVSSVQLDAPVPRPRRNIFCVGKNYRDHVAELARAGTLTDGPEALPAAPIVFTKPPTAVVGPNQAVLSHPTVTSELDYEAELAVIIGRGGRAISPDEAWQHVWGYTAVNDVTARDLQRRHRQWFLGKGLDTFCPMGPWAVTADAFDLSAAVVSCRVNGELRQQAPVTDLINGIPELIATISAGMTLWPGDVIATGTPGGVGAGFDPPRYLRPGDIVAIDVTGVGTLVNHIS